MQGVASLRLMTECVKIYATGNSWLPGKVTSKLGSTMYNLLFNDGRNVHKYADQMRSRIENDQCDNVVGMNSDIDDSFEMRVPRTGEQQESNEEAATEPSGGEPLLTSTTTDSTNGDDPEPELEMPENVEPSLPPVRHSSRQRNQTDFYEVVSI